MNKFTIKQLEEINPLFDFNNYKVCDGSVFGLYSLQCLTPKEYKVFHKIWLDEKGNIILNSLKMIKIQIKAEDTKRLLIEEIKNTMCNPINRSLSWCKVYDEWDIKVKAIRQKEKGINRLERKIQKLALENGGSRVNNKIEELRYNYHI